MFQYVRIAKLGVDIGFLSFDDDGLPDISMNGGRTLEFFDICRYR
jgi:hypothetical protein